METFVICIDNHNYQASLELFKVYVALPDAKEDYLYPQEIFAQVNLPEKTTQIFLSTLSNDGQYQGQ